MHVNYLLYIILSFCASDFLENKFRRVRAAVAVFAYKDVLIIRGETAAAYRSALFELIAPVGFVVVPELNGLAVREFEAEIYEAPGS